MPLARSFSVGLVGVDGYLVEVEADLAAGLPGMTLVGLPDAALHEARDRIRAAVVNSGQGWPGRRLTVGLSPASLPKRGSGFDVAIAIAVLAAAGAVPPAAAADLVLVGELGLDGRIRPVKGVLPAVLAALAAGRTRVVVPGANVAEAVLVPGVEVVGVDRLDALVGWLCGGPLPTVEPPDGAAREPAEPVPDLADVLGQGEARWGIEVAAAGGHHVFLHGPPGAGKTMLAERLPGLLPELTPEAALEVTAIHSVAGTLRPGAPLVNRPPFAAPHHTATVAALVGGGSGMPRPGAASLANRGVLFLDEAPEFSPGCLDALREPLESGQVMVARSAGMIRYPARFTLVLAANPCPCGAVDPLACTCSPIVRRRYLGRLSGPLLDRIDMTVVMTAVSRVSLLADASFAESTATVAARVAAARERAGRRLAETPWRLASEIPGRELRRDFAPERAAFGYLEEALRRGSLTARGLDRTLRLAWTLAFLGGRERPGLGEVTAAAGLRWGVAA